MKKPRPTKAARRASARAADLRRRLHCARDEIGAMLFFLVPPDGRHPKRRSDTVFALDRQIRNLVGLAEALRTGDFSEITCLACGKPLKPGQRVVHVEDEDDMHSACFPDAPEKFVYRRDTLAEEEARTRRHLDDARKYLASKGMSA